MAKFPQWQNVYLLSLSRKYCVPWQLTTSLGGKQTFESFEVFDIQFMITLRQWWEYLTLRKIITFGFIKRGDKGQITTVNDLES